MKGELVTLSIRKEGGRAFVRQTSLTDQEKPAEADQLRHT